MNDARQIRFYHLTLRRLEDALCALLAKSLASGRRVLVRCGGSADLEALSRALWNDAGPAYFLAHGRAGVDDKSAQDQPIWITSGVENPNGAQILFLLPGAVMEEGDSTYPLICYLFSGGDEAALASARKAWKTIKEGGAAPTYWQETPEGAWAQKA